MGRVPRPAAHRRAKPSPPARVGVMTKMGATHCRLGCVLVVALCLGCGGKPASSGGGGSPSAPSVSQITPNYAFPGQQNLTIVLLGSGMATGDRIFWGATPLNTTVGTAGWQALVPPQLLAAGPDLIPITVVAANGTASNAFNFDLAAPQQAQAGVVELITAAPDGKLADGDTLTQASMSADGRFVVFDSNADNLVPGPASGFSDIYERDTCLGAPPGCTPTTFRISVGYDGSPPNGNSSIPTVSDDGRFVVLNSSATNLVPNDGETGNREDVFLRDTCLGATRACTPATTRISVAPGGANPDSASGSGGTLSHDGRYVLFGSGDNLIPGLPSAHGYAYQFDSCRGAPSSCTAGISLIPFVPAGQPPSSQSGISWQTPNDRYQVVATFDGRLTPGVANPLGFLLLYDTCRNAAPSCVPGYTPVSVSNSGEWPNGRMAFDEAATLSDDGRYIPFSSFGSNLTPGPMIGNGTEVFLRDTCVGTTGTSCAPSTIKLTHGYDGSSSNYGSGGEMISGNGRFVAFDSIATNLVPGENNPPGTRRDIFVIDTCNGPAPSPCRPGIVRVSVVGPGGVLPQGTPSDSIDNAFAKITADGKYVIFVSGAQNLLPSGPVTFTAHQQVYRARTGY